MLDKEYKFSLTMTDPSGNTATKTVCFYPDIEELNICNIDSQIEFSLKVVFDKFNTWVKQTIIHWSNVKQSKAHKGS